LFLHLSFTNGLLGGFVGSSSGNDLSLASGRLQVRSSHMDFLGNDSTIDHFIHNNTDGTFIDIEDNTSSSVIVLERKTLVNRGINFNINIVSSLQKRISCEIIFCVYYWLKRATNLEVSQEGGGVRRTLSFEGLFE
jgi:hypothetical protein